MVFMLMFYGSTIDARAGTETPASPACKMAGVSRNTFIGTTKNNCSVYQLRHFVAEVTPVFMWQLRRPPRLRYGEVVTPTFNITLANKKLDNETTSQPPRQSLE